MKYTTKEFQGTNELDQWIDTRIEVEDITEALSKLPGRAADLIVWRMSRDLIQKRLVFDTKLFQQIVRVGRHVIQYTRCHYERDSIEQELIRNNSRKKSLIIEIFAKDNDFKLSKAAKKLKRHWIAISPKAEIKCRTSNFLPND